LKSEICPEGAERDLSMKKCDATCQHLRGIAYGFDGSRLLTRYNGKDKFGTCAKLPHITIYMRSLPVCALERMHDECSHP
jgi:hypothetical protein